MSASVPDRNDDLVEARKICGEFDQGSRNIWLSGEWDNSISIKQVLRALQRGRELALGTT